LSITIEDLLQRRSDLSTFIVHLTKDADADARETLLKILTEGRLRAGQPQGLTDGLNQPHLDQLRVVCFSETPLEHAYSLFQEIANRGVHLKPYGLAFTKAIARRNSVNPVWYVDQTPGQTRGWEITKALDRLKLGFAAATDELVQHPAASILPFVEIMGTWPTTGTKKEFSWEREWRHHGDMNFLAEEVAVVLCPAADHTAFRKLGYRAIDPSWSLERMIEHLANPRTDRPVV